METEKISSSHVPDSAREPYSSGTRSHVPVGDIYGPGQDVILPLVETEINSRVWATQEADSKTTCASLKSILKTFLYFPITSKNF